VPVDRISEHEVRLGALLADFSAAKTQGAPIGLRKTTSNLFRHRNAESKRRLNVRAFDHVLQIDPERMIADVEGMTTYETLVEETLKFGLLPAVVPQLKTITVGGAVSGLGIESSSFRYGLVHETVEEMEVLTGNGCVIECSACKNRGLFFGFPNSYGTLGYTLRLKIRLVPAKPYVCLAHTRFSEAGEYFARVEQLCGDGTVDFLDGTIFGLDEMYVTEGFFVDEAPQVSDYTYMDIYYRSIQARGQRQQKDWLTSKDYIWRWDTDWFWCSKHFGVQNLTVRFFAKPILNSRTYQRLMRLSQRWVPDSGKTESVIQDVQIPIEHAHEFCHFLLREIGVTPVWVCPFRTSDRTFDLCAAKPNQLYINFGFWDVIPTRHEAGHYNKMIEREVAGWGGTKGLYSTSYYDRDTFWSLYDQQRYDALKNLYDPDRMFPDLYAKCVERR
jgi:FAD/FMN-containing dehydrogenase